MMPNGRSIPRGVLGPLSRNVVKFSPDSRVLFIGGFGNLSGDMDFFETKNFSVLGRANAHTTTQVEWSPDGAFLCCGVTAPRRHIDNGFHIFSVNGQLVYSQFVPELYDFEWKPSKSITFSALRNPIPHPMPPADPEARITLPHGSSPSSSSSSLSASTDKAKASTTSAPAAAPTTVPTGKYIPPHLRRAAAAQAAQSTPTRTTPPASETMQVFNRDGTRVTQQPKTQQQRPQNVPVGGQPASSSKSKGKKHHDRSMQMARREYY